jgi:hypothetical protein
MRAKTCRRALLLLAVSFLAPGLVRAENPPRSGFGGEAGLADLPPRMSSNQILEQAASAPPRAPVTYATSRYQDPEVAFIFRGQDSTGYGKPEVELPVPIGSTRPEDGGFFVGAEYVMFKQTNPLHNQTIAYDGFIDVDGTIATMGPGFYVGNGTDRLNARQVSGPGTYQPGFIIDLGWRFAGGDDAWSLTFSWMYLTEAAYHASATLTPPFLQVGPTGAQSFLVANVYGFPNDYSGPAQKIGSGADFAAYGVWNGASIMNLAFTQRTQQYDMTIRMPFDWCETKNYRMSGLMGPRFFWIWENFWWRAQDIDVASGGTGPTDVAIYNNTVSNRMYGAHIGIEQEWYIGHGFATMLNTEVVGYMDVYKMRASYGLGERGNLGPEAKRSRTDYTFVSEFACKAELMWYPTQAIQVKFGYDLMLFLNTIASQRPVDFNFSSLAPDYNHVVRLFDGWTAAIVFEF